MGGGVDTISKVKSPHARDLYSPSHPTPPYSHTDNWFKPAECYRLHAIVLVNAAVQVGTPFQLKLLTDNTDILHTN